MKQTMTILALGFLVACGSSPTSPTQAGPQQSTKQTAPEPGGAAEPTPTPTTPVPPVPAPPAPTPPVPAPPTPAPPEAAKTVLRATVEMSHWYPGATFTLPDAFDLVIQGDTLKIAALDPLPFSLYHGTDDFIVKRTDFELVVQGTTFTFNGLAGQAFGTVSPAK